MTPSDVTRATSSMSDAYSRTWSLRPLACAEILEHRRCQFAHLIPERLGRVDRIEPGGVNRSAALRRRANHS
jgi:hypothetical protein